MRFIISTLSLFILFSSITIGSGVVHAEKKDDSSQEPRTEKRAVFGWVEKVEVSPLGTVMHAKLSPINESSTIDARDIKEFKKGKKRWVRFTVQDRYGNEVTQELPVARVSKVKRSSGSVRRYAVVLGLCLGGIFREEEVSLANRRNLEHDMLIGRTFLAGMAVIDPAVSYTKTPRCKSKS